MDKELEQLRKVFAESDVVVEKCGIGKVNAALGAAEMIRRHRPDVIISSGCAGGNGDGINVQDIVVGAEVCYHDVYCGTAIDNTTVYGQVQGMPARYKADPYLLRKSEELRSKIRRQQEKLTNSEDLPNTQHPSSIILHPGLIVTGDWFVDSKEKMRSIIEKFPEAIAVDMESAAIAQACHIYNVPFISFRVVSDIPLRDTDASQYHNFWENIAENSFHVTRTFVEMIRED